MSDTTQSTPQNDDQNKLSKGTIVEQNGVKFEQIEPDQLTSVPVISQALDNQWFPQSLLYEAVKAGKISDDLERRRAKIVRAEYIRSLINGRQVVINRAFFINNPVIFQDYMPVLNSDPVDDSKREAFKKLLGDKVIIPHLFKEQSPVQQQKFSTVSPDEWTKVCGEVQGMQCLRLSWDDEENNEKSNIFLAGGFTDFTLTIGSPRKDFRKYIESFSNLEEKTHREALKKRLLKVIQESTEFLGKNDYVTREYLYTVFVTIDGTNPSDRRYDKSKPFAAEIKQLLDLAYNRNLPDALNGYLLTPIDSLHRTALQEDVFGNTTEKFTEKIQTMLQRAVFDLVQDGLFLQSLDLLSLADVYEIRKTTVWENYIISLEALLDKPLSFAAGGAQTVHRNYYLLMEEMTKQIRVRYQESMTEMVAQTKFVVELIIEIGGGAITLMGTGDPTSTLILKVVEPVFANVGRRVASFVVRFVIRDIAEGKAEKGLSNSIELMKGKLTNAEKEWKELLSYVNLELKAQEHQIIEDNSSTLNSPSPTS